MRRTGLSASAELLVIICLWVIPCQFNNSSSMTISEFDEIFKWL